MLAVLGILFQESNTTQADGLYITHPDPVVFMDEDSGDEDGGIADNLNSSQLQAEAEIRLTEETKKN